MNENNVSPLAIAEKFSRVVKLWHNLEKKPQKFGTDEDLYSSEIHLIETIGENNNFSVTDIAKQLGVTKGAVSQTLKKLEIKGLTAKHVDPHNSSRAIVELTSKGKMAFYAHAHWHEQMDGGFKTYMNSLTQEQMDLIYEVLSNVENFLNLRL
ncbi:transcriptional regulator, MarR family [Desulfosarcina variabilis str. Montpellier]|uniref:MarR family winged helix-turn-helix transcriptional regulator n=1 Tax=Desulfosarcina variabilis TaxID=2300 RepID=UPI003AFAD715